MAKIEFTKTELFWPGKYNEEGTRGKDPGLTSFSFLSAVAFQQSITRQKFLS